MGRPRSFDHAEAGRLRAAGVPVAEIAARLGVSTNSVYSATADPARRERRRQRQAERFQDAKVPCAAGCGRLVSRPMPSRPRRTGLCAPCLGAAISVTVRPDTLLCSRCEKWKPDEDFPHRHDALTRRGRHPLCRPCGTIVRQEFRDKRKIPCDRCGAPRLPQSEKSRGEWGDSGLCRPCYIASITLNPVS